MHAASTLITVCCFLTNVLFFLHMLYLLNIVSGFDQAECHLSGMHKPSLTATLASTLNLFII